MRFTLYLTLLGEGQSGYSYFFCTSKIKKHPVQKRLEYQRLYLLGLDSNRLEYQSLEYQRLYLLGLDSNLQPHGPSLQVTRGQVCIPKKRHFLGIFPKWRTPPPFGNPKMKFFRVYFVFQAIRIIFCFHKKMIFCHWSVVPLAMFF